ncbi:cutinase-domain-containing protein [Mycena alexandri]|uniref:cutinase n=1 Tax=Mycena alexandri TaxID=1745969 RepID=A0AAD6SL53_9AGAR|nr:cutinase-domain-containing protein [Mycena alexandri]
MLSLLLALSSLVAGTVAYPHNLDLNEPWLNSPTPLQVPPTGSSTTAPAQVLGSDQMNTRDIPGYLTGELGGPSDVENLSLGINASGGSDDTGTGCGDVIVIFARGTTEAAPLGDRVGPQLEDALSALLTPEGKILTFMGVANYSASIAGFLEGGDPDGSKAMASQLTLAARFCPDASVVSVGYSQGAQLVHNSAKQLPSDVVSHIKAVVTFGDPDSRETVSGIPASKTCVICHSDDGVCGGNGILNILLLLLFLENHLDYAQDVGTAAKFIVGKV